MPRLAEDELSDTESNVGDIPANEEDANAEEQVNGELQDEVEEAQAEAEPAVGAREADAAADEASDAKAEDDVEANSDVPEDEYEVESIQGHRFKSRIIQLDVKWIGYEERTWEPEENLLPDAKDLLAQYYNSLGGQPQPPGKSSQPAGRPMRRKSTQSLKESSVEQPSAKKFKRGGTVNTEDQPLGSWTPKAANWEDEIAEVDTIERDHATGKLWVFLSFTNGKKTRVGMDKVYKHCPLTMLRFYEQHLKFN